MFDYMCILLQTTASQNYQILWREAYLNHMRDSPYFLAPKIPNANSTLQSYSDQWAVRLSHPICIHYSSNI